MVAASRFPFAAALALALAACGQSDVGAGGAGAEGSGGMTAQLKASCVRYMDEGGPLAEVGDQICDCASRRAREELSVTALMSGDDSALQTIITQCADEALGLRGDAKTNKAES